ncbi:response regulator transcription factor [Luminiphilus sp. nBUS_07]|uniref:response regulator transcription factor n=1 Tax=Luminiphilus sp. nBUS_07 TaxID=3395314 RepID=UPI003EB6CCC5
MPSQRWYRAFPDLTLFNSVKAYMVQAHNRAAVCWLDSLGLSDSELLKASGILAKESAPVVVLSATPSESEAFSVLATGVKGYCHAESVPEQFVEVAQAVASGGYWVPPELVQRFATAALTVGAVKTSEVPEGFDQLTEREYQVAMAVGKGFNNKEIASQLGLGERTIKAHLTTTFEKLQVRDRVQLALIVNRLPLH